MPAKNIFEQFEGKQVKLITTHSPTPRHVTFVTNNAVGVLFKIGTYDFSFVPFTAIHDIVVTVPQEDEE